MMKKGLLWFDDRKEVSLSQKINAAVKYYSEKYGMKAEVCFVNPNVPIEDEKQEIELRIESSAYIMPNHFLIEPE